MADVFNQNPTTYVDLNEMFPVLNEKIGLTYEQWRVAIENCNYLKNNLGVSNVAIGTITTHVVEGEEKTSVNITTREVVIEDKPIVYLDFEFNFAVDDNKLDIQYIYELADNYKWIRKIENYVDDKTLVFNINNKYTGNGDNRLSNTMSSYIYPEENQNSLEFYANKHQETDIISSGITITPEDVLLERNGLGVSPIATLNDLETQINQSIISVLNTEV